MNFKIITFFVFCIFIFASCEEEKRGINYYTYKNRVNHNIHVGDTFMLVFTSNSCCPNRWPDTTTFNSIKLIKDTIVKKPPEDCDGCTTYFALIFKGIQQGNDIIKYITYNPNNNWDEIKNDTTKYNSENYYVKVSK